MAIQPEFFMSDTQATIGFYGGVGSVTGANFMLDTGKIAVLIDCGLIQGGGSTVEMNAKPFPYHAPDVDVLLVTHAHADHIGRIAKLVHDGFAGTIYSTPPTKALAAVMMQDAYHIMQLEHEEYDVPLWYDAVDIDTAFSNWKTLGYHEWCTLGDNVSMQFTDAGHILGSAMVHLQRGDRTVVCTGDIGNVPQPLMAPPEIPTGHQYLITESVYGDRTHEAVEERSAILREHIERTRAKNGTLIIPAFSLERTQSMLYEINNFIEEAGMEPLPVFLDSPLAIEVTDIYRRYPRYLNSVAQERLQHDDDLFRFPGFTATPTVRDSQVITRTEGPKIIIAGSGMSHGGRIRRHEKAYLSDPTTTLLLVGHQVVGSLGRRLQDGATQVVIDGQSVSVHAEVATIRGFSGHADRDQLLETVAGGAQSLEQVFVAMGEERASLFLAQRINDYIGIPALVPEECQEVVITF
jgi:metallo-beta-lactamase family protein